MGFHEVLATASTSAISAVCMTYLTQRPSVERCLRHVTVPASLLGPSAASSGLSAPAVAPPRVLLVASLRRAPLTEGLRVKCPRASTHPNTVARARESPEECGGLQRTGEPRIHGQRRELRQRKEKGSRKAQKLPYVCSRTRFKLKLPGPSFRSSG